MKRFTTVGRLSGADRAGGGLGRGAGRAVRPAERFFRYDRRAVDASDAAKLLDFAGALADAAAAEILPHFRTSLHIGNKSGASGFDPVTEADRAAERAVRERISASYPDHRIVGEEYGASPGSGLCWFIDPIDGTRAFISGLPVWGTLIALYDAAAPVVGLMNQPFTGERFVGWDGRAWLEHRGDERELTVRRCGELADAVLMSTDPAMFRGERLQRAFARVAGSTRLTRYGGDCYAYCMLAMGQIDLVIEADLKIYDTAALIPIIEGAGGVITGWQGQPALGAERVVAAGDRDVHRQVLDLLN